MKVAVAPKRPDVQLSLTPEEADLLRMCLGLLVDGPVLSEVLCRDEDVDDALKLFSNISEALFHLDY